MKTDICTFVIKSRWILLRKRNISDKCCGETQNTHFVFSNPPPENRVVYEIMWKNIVERGRAQMAIQRMRSACWVTKATDTHSTCNTDSFFTVTLVTRTRLNVTLYIAGLVLAICKANTQRTSKYVSQRLYCTMPVYQVIATSCSNTMYSTQVYSQATQQNSTYPD
jgi:hypothetical protein